jgi:hypothetical protein
MTMEVPPFAPNFDKVDMSFDNTIAVLNEAFAEQRNRELEKVKDRELYTVQYSENKVQFQRIQQHRNAIIDYYKKLGWRNVRVLEEKHFSTKVILVEVKK